MKKLIEFLFDISIIFINSTHASLLIFYLFACYFFEMNNQTSTNWFEMMENDDQLDCGALDYDLHNHCESPNICPAISCPTVAGLCGASVQTLHRCPQALLEDMMLASYPPTTVPIMVKRKQKRAVTSAVVAIESVPIVAATESMPVATTPETVPVVITKSAPVVATPEPVLVPAWRPTRGRSMSQTAPSQASVPIAVPVPWRSNARGHSQSITSASTSVLAGLDMTPASMPTCGTAHGRRLSCGPSRPNIQMAPQQHQQVRAFLQTRSSSQTRVPPPQHAMAFAPAHNNWQAPIAPMSAQWSAMSVVHGNEVTPVIHGIRYCWNVARCSGRNTNAYGPEDWCGKCSRIAKATIDKYPTVCDHCRVLIEMKCDDVVGCPRIKSTRTCR